jgi:hypothetical protein
MHHIAEFETRRQNHREGDSFPERVGWSRASNRQIISTQAMSVCAMDHKPKCRLHRDDGAVQSACVAARDRYNTKRRLVFAIGIDLRDIAIRAQTTGKHRCGFLRMKPRSARQSRQIAQPLEQGRSELLVRGPPAPVAVWAPRPVHARVGAEIEDVLHRRQREHCPRFPNQSD